jgi:tetratricopeptide (TPR) repeat protein
LDSISPTGPEAVQAARTRVVASPGDAEAQFALGNTLWWAGERDEAVQALARAVALRPDHADARNNLGNALIELGRPEEAVPHYRAALAMRPKHAPTHYNLGNALLAAGHPADAEACFNTALALDANHAGALNNLGNALRALGRPAEAAEAYRKVVALRPDYAGTHNNLGSALLALHRPAEAAACFVEALRRQPDYAEACNNLGGALLAMDRPEQAIQLFRRAVTQDAGMAQARFGESLALLTLGRFREGWEQYESRWLDPRFREGTRSYDLKLWLNRPGEDVLGRTVLLHAEQGLGDTIHFVRYAPLLRRLGARVVLEVQAPLVKLLRGLGDPVLSEGAELPRCDLRCPLLSLPLAFRTEPRNIPASIPYLRADQATRQAWQQALGPRTRPRIGIAFSGSPDHPEDALRSIPAAQLLPLLAVPPAPGAEFHVVQKDIRPADAAALRMAQGVRTYADRLTDFSETAALLSLMDLVITVDTSVAHLAGAMGLPVWLLLQHAADFRWLRGREDSPWYPTARLFRQSHAGRWEPVLARVADALRTLAPHPPEVADA